MNCPRCGTANSAGRRFCVKCGSPLALACSSCGFSNEPGVKFCRGCGAALGAYPAGPKFAAPETYTPRLSPAWPGEGARRYRVLDLPRETLGRPEAGDVTTRS